MRGAVSLIAINAVVAVVLLIVIVGEWRQGVEPAVPDAKGVGGRTLRIPGVDAMPQLRVVSIEDYGAIVARPLFNPDRRPAPVAVVADEAVGSAIDKLVLTGIVTGPDKKLAIFVNGNDPKELRLEEGGTFQGWRLVAFTESGVSFSREGSTRELPLYKEQRTADSSTSGSVRPKGALRRYLKRRQRSQDQQP